MLKSMIVMLVTFGCTLCSTLAYARNTTEEDVAACAANDVNACGNLAIHMGQVECYPEMAYYYYKAFRLGDKLFSPKVKIRELLRAIRDAEDVDNWADADDRNSLRNPNGPEARARKRPLQYWLTALRHPPKTPSSWCGIGVENGAQERIMNVPNLDSFRKHDAD